MESLASTNLILKNGNFFEAFYTSETSIKYAIKKGIYFG